MQGSKNLITPREGMVSAALFFNTNTNLVYPPLPFQARNDAEINFGNDHNHIMRGSLED